MANMASVSYVIEGSKEALKRVYEAIQHPDNSEGDEGWEGGVLKALGITWKDSQPDGSGYYMRGFIQDTESIEFYPDSTTLSFWAEEAWGATDFHDILEKEIPGIKVYYCVVEEGCEVYATNDKEGKYFPYRWHVEAAFDNNYEYEDFIKDKDMYDWLSSKTDGRVKSLKDVEDFNSDYEDSGADDENYINIHKFEIV